MSLDAHVADGAGGATTLTLAHCSYHPDLLAPDPVGVREFIHSKKLTTARRPLTLKYEEATLMDYVAARELVRLRYELRRLLVERPAGAEPPPA